MNKEKEEKKNEIEEIKEKEKKQPSIFTPIMHSEPPHERTTFPSIPVRSEPS